MIELIDLLVSATEFARALDVRMHDDGAEAIGIHRVEGELHELNVAEALEGVGGLEDILAAAENIGVLVARIAEIIRVEVALGIQHLGVMQNDAVTLLSFDADLYVARHVLSEVQDQFSLGRAEDLDGRQALVLGDPFAVLRSKLTLDRGIKLRLADIFDGRGLIHGLAVVDLGEGDLVGVNVPGLVRDELLLGAVRIANAQPRDGGDVVGKGVIGVDVSDVTDRPALANTDLKAVLFAQERGDVIGLVKHARLVGGKAGRQHALTHALAVEKERIVAHGAYAKRSLLDRLFAGQLAAEGGCRHAHVSGSGDPFCICFHAFILGFPTGEKPSFLSLVLRRAKARGRGSETFFFFFAKPLETIIAYVL